MAVTHIAENRETYGPYTATIGSLTGQDYDIGYVRIEPPFVPGSYLKTYFDNDGIEFEHVASDSNSTLLRYSVEAWGSGSQETKQRITEATGTLLEYLGTVASGDIFEKYCNKYDGERK